MPKMKLRTTLILFLLALGIGLYIKFYETKRPNTEEANRRAQNVVNFERDNIDGVTIQNGEERIELKRTNNKWRLEAPVKDLADGSLVDNLLFDLDGWQKEGTIAAKEIESDKGKLAEYGLTKAKLKLKLSGKEAPPEIWFGNNTALENRVYVRLDNSKDVFLAGKNIRDEVSKKPEDFRDRKLTDLVPTQVNKVVLKSSAGELELQKVANHWQITKPMRARADDQKVNDMIARITNSRIQQFVAGDGGDPHPYGLSEPRGSVTLFSGEDTTGQVLEIGSPGHKDQVYVRFVPRRFVYTLPKTIDEILNYKPNDLRDTHLVRFDRNQLDRVTLDGREKGKTVLARKGEDWTIANKKGVRANGPEVRRLLDLLDNLPAVGFVEEVASDLAKYGLNQPPLVLTLSSFASENTAESNAGEQPLATIAFGKVEGDSVYARVGEEPYVVKVRRQVLDQIWKTPVAWQDPAIYSFTPQQVHRITINSGPTAVRVSDHEWKGVEGGGNINQGNVQGLATSVAKLRAVRWLGQEPPASAFDQPAAIITFATSPDDKVAHKLTIGSPTDDGMWMARSDEHEGTFVISGPDFNALRQPIDAPPATPANAPSPTSPSPAAARP